MKTYLSIAMSIAASLGIATVAAARGGGGGGGHFGGGGGHFGGGGGHFEGGHFGGGEHFGGGMHFGEGRHDSHRDGIGRRGVFGNEYWPYYGDDGYSDMSNSTPYYDETDSNVAAVQRALAHEGYYHGPIDGALDLITQDAIARYDRDHHLPVSHGVDESLMSALGI